jgi:hypothetical protein
MLQATGSRIDPVLKGSGDLDLHQLGVLFGNKGAHPTPWDEVTLPGQQIQGFSDGYIADLEFFLQFPCRRDQGFGTVDIVQDSTPNGFSYLDESVNGLNSVHADGSLLMKSLRDFIICNLDRMSYCQKGSRPRQVHWYTYIQNDRTGSIQNICFPGIIPYKKHISGFRKKERQPPKALFSNNN